MCFVKNQLFPQEFQKFVAKTKKSTVTFSFILVILGQPNFDAIQFLAPKHTRRVKNIQVHPKYRGKPDGIKNPTRDQSPIFDFALIEVTKPMFASHQNYDFKFEQTVRPVCLPSREMWRSKFYKQSAIVSGYGRKEAIKIRGKDQSASQLMQADLRIISPNDRKCAKVKFTYLSI